MASALFFSTQNWTPKEHPICYRVTHTRQPQFKAGIPKSEKTTTASHKNHLIQTLWRYTTKDTQNSIQDYPKTQEQNKIAVWCMLLHLVKKIGWLERKVHMSIWVQMLWRITTVDTQNWIQDYPKTREQNKIAVWCMLLHLVKRIGWLKRKVYMSIGVQILWR